MNRIYRTRIERCYSWRTILLVLAGIAVNASLPQLMRVGNVPLYLDNIGSVLVAALAGPLPGMIAAFVSNYLGYLGEPSSIMFGFLTVAMAWIAGDCSRRGLFRTMKGYLWLLAAFTGVGGAVGSVLGWEWYGHTVGATIAAPYVFWLSGHGLSGFAAQFVGDVILDVMDKAITLAVVGLVLRFYPVEWRDFFPLSYIYGCSEEELEQTYEKLKEPYEGNSVYFKIISIITFPLVILSALVTGFATYEFYHKVYLNNHSISELLTYVIQTIGLEFAIIMLVMVAAGWRLYRTLKKPLDDIIRLIIAFGISDPETWLESEEWRKRRRIHTKDEVQVLYDAVCESEESIAQKVISIRENEQMLKELSETDLMTGIRNRGSGEMQIRDKIACGREGILCVFDCDNFKRINDTYGHAAGDKVLIAIAGKMGSVSRRGDIVFRLGGDEFAMYLTGIRNERDAEHFFNRFFDAVRTIEVPELQGYPISVSLGAVFYRKGEAVDFDTLYQKADEMLYQCKKISGFSAKIYK